VIAPRLPRIDVGILGCTGIVGQQFVRLLAEHPWFRVVWIAGSKRSAGGRFGEVVEWRVEGSVPPVAASQVLQEPGAPCQAPVFFSALPADAARRLESWYRDLGHTVFTNASPHRFGEERMPIVAEVNGNRLGDLFHGSTEGQGTIIANPNCVVAGLAPPLAAVNEAFGLEEVTVTTLQALSGAGRTGVAALHALGNVIPHIPGESEKIALETRAILGVDIPMSVDVHRVPVATGHLASVRVRTAIRPQVPVLCETLASFRSADPLPALPSAPPAPIRVHDMPGRPQPMLDAMEGAGMTVSVGGIDQDALCDARFEILVHNTIRGAAGGSVLNAELAVAEGLVGADARNPTTPHAV